MSPEVVGAVPELDGYRYSNGVLNHSHGYLLPAVERLLTEIATRQGSRRIFELGCGNGSVAAHLTGKGFDVTGVDPSADGIRHANATRPDLRLELGNAYEDLSSRFGTFPIVLSLEVVEHVYFPRKYAACIHSLLAPGGIAVISTPYHGYWKNLTMALSGKLDAHFTALWDYGHIKFWSERTLSALLAEAGLSVIDFKRVGRIPPLAKSMIAVARKA